MKFRVPNPVGVLATAISLGLIGMYIAENYVDPRTHYLSLGQNFHISLMGDDREIADAHITFFNDAAYGPYRGSIIYIDTPPPGFVKRGFGYWRGIYFRHFSMSGGKLWTLTIDLAWFAAPALAIAAFWLWPIAFGKPKNP